MIDGPDDQDAIDALFSALDGFGEGPFWNGAEPVRRGRRLQRIMGGALRIAVGVVPGFMIPGGDGRQVRLRADAVVGDDLADDRHALGIVHLEEQLAGAGLEDVDVAHVEGDGEVLAVGIRNEGGDAIVEAVGGLSRCSLRQSEGQQDGQGDESEACHQAAVLSVGRVKEWMSGL